MDRPQALVVLLCRLALLDSSSRGRASRASWSDAKRIAHSGCFGRCCTALPLASASFLWTTTHIHVSNANKTCTRDDNLIPVLTSTSVTAASVPSCGGNQRFILQLHGGQRCKSDSAYERPSARVCDVGVSQASGPALSTVSCAMRTARADVLMHQRLRAQGASRRCSSAPHTIACGARCECASVASCSGAGCSRDRGNNRRIAGILMVQNHGLSPWRGGHAERRCCACVKECQSSRNESSVCSAGFLPLPICRTLAIEAK